MKKILFFDIDGTLFDNLNNEVPESTIRSIKKLSEDENILLFVATGRSNVNLCSIDTVIDYFDGVLAINGSYITYKDQVLLHDYLVKDKLTELISVLDESKLSYGYQAYDNEAINVYTDEILNLFKNLSLPLPKYEPKISNKQKVSQMYVFGNKEEIKALEKKLPDYRVITWRKGGADIIKKEISKISGIEFVAKHFNVDDDHLYCFGDGENDIEMVKDVKNSVAMGNAVECIKAVADYVTDTVSNDGIEKALKHYKLI